MSICSPWRALTGPSSGSGLDVWCERERRGAQTVCGTCRKGGARCILVVFLFLDTEMQAGDIRPALLQVREGFERGIHRMLWIKVGGSSQDMSVVAQSETSRVTGALDEGTFGVDAVRPSGGKSERKQKTPATELVRVVGQTACCLAVVAFCRNICGQGPPFCRTTGASPVSTPSRLGEQRGAFVA